MSLTAEELAERQIAEAELRALKRPVLELADAIAMYRRAWEDLEWAVRMTDPGQERRNFDQASADERLRQAIPTFRRLRDHVDFLLDRDGWR